MSANKRFIPNDAKLPFLAVAMDADAMGLVFEQHFRLFDGICVQACEIERVKYRPQRNCLIGYKLRLSDNSGTREQRLYAGMYTSAEASARFNAALAAECLPTDFPSVSMIAALNLVVWAFPNDRKLSSIPLLDDPDQLREHVLPKVVHARWGDGWEIVDCVSVISNYFPEHSCCVNVKLSLCHSSNGDRRDWEIIGKHRFDNAGEQTIAVMAALWAKADERVYYARPILYQHEQQVLWQQRVSGVTLNSQLTYTLNNSELLGRVACAIAALHATAIPTTHRVTRENLIDRLSVAEKVLTEACPNDADRLCQLVSTLYERASSLDVQHECTWHGDLHSNNILISPDQVYLIDLDGVCIGAPAAELGSFFAELIYRGCLNREPIESVVSSINGFLEIYQRQVSWPVSALDIAWYTASALVYERALRCVTSLKGGHNQIIENLIATALRILTANPFVISCRTAVQSANQLSEAA